MRNKTDGYAFRAKFTPSMARWRGNDETSYSKVKTNILLSK